MSDAQHAAYEAIVMAAWRDTFERDVRHDDDFFALGGDSLRALQVVERLSVAVRIPEALAAAVLAGVFDNPSPRSFAVFVRSLAVELVDRQQRTGV